MSNLRLSSDLKTRHEAFILELGPSGPLRHTYLEAGLSTLVDAIAYSGGKIIVTGVIGSRALWATLQ